MVTKEQITSLIGSGGDVLTGDGDRIGGIGTFYLDDESDSPRWVTVTTGLFGTHESFVPLADARVQGNDLVVSYTKDQVKDAPRVDTDGHLEPAEEERLYQHYSLDGRFGGMDGRERTGLVDREAGTAASEARPAGAVGRDTSGPTTDDAMTRSEERLHVGTERQETGRARLRKYVTTENVTKTIPVQREEIRVEREPITEENRDAAMRGPAISEEEHEVTLHEERPVVEKEAVPVERVRLGTETVTEEATVREEIAKENIDVDDSNRPG